jgi:two-component system response regulator (stage 0 sporulation protein F)
MNGADEIGVHRDRAEHGSLARERPALTILLAEDDSELRGLLAGALRRDGHCVRELVDGGQLEWELARTYRDGPSGDRDCLVVADVRMPVIDGLTVLQDCRKQGLHPPFILMSAFADPTLHATAKHLNAVAVFDKPFDLDGLRAAIAYYARWRGLRVG